jgi:hypothetical protein
MAHFYSIERSAILIPMPAHSFLSRMNSCYAHWYWHEWTLRLEKYNEMPRVATKLRDAVQRYPYLRVRPQNAVRPVDDDLNDLIALLVAERGEAMRPGGAAGRRSRNGRRYPGPSSVVADVTSSVARGCG